MVEGCIVGFGIMQVLELVHQYLVIRAAKIRKIVYTLWLLVHSFSIYRMYFELKLLLLHDYEP